MAEAYEVLIVGSGHGAAQAAIKLRQGGHAGSIAMITEEADLPYERPPLSKDYLAGTKGFAQIQLRPAQFWQERSIEVLYGRRVVQVDPVAHRVIDSAGGAVGYQKLIWAAGGRARQLACSGGKLEGVHSIRTRRDVDTLRAELPAADSIIIIGGGYIGLEAAAAFVSLGKEVVLLEMESRVLARVAGAPLSQFYQREHTQRGVEIMLSTRVDRILEENGRASGVRLVGGTQLAASLIVVGIGILPVVEPLIQSGAAGVNGVDVDEHCRTSLVDVYAVGDCASHESSFAAGHRIRLESVQNAVDQASCAALHILGKPQPYYAVPWFWSDQYDLKLQTIGLAMGYDETLVRGDPATRVFSVLYRRAGRVIALDCVNSPRDYMQGKELIRAAAVLPAERLMDRTVPLRTLCAQ